MTNSQSHILVSPLPPITSPGLPRISIVMPSYNQARYLTPAIESIVSQDYPNLECIVIDGGSTDESAEIIRSYAPRLHYWVSEPDRGQTHAINKGFAVATGDILAYLNSDDLYLPGALHKVAKAFAEYPEVDVIYGRIHIVDEHGNMMREHAGRISTYAELLDLWRVWWARRQFVQPEVFWRRRIAEKCGPFDESLHNVMDYEYWLRMASQGATFLHLPEALSCFRVTPGQKSSHAQKAADELLLVAKHYLDRRDLPVSYWKRLRLRADWAFDARFRTLADQMMSDGVSPRRRWAALAALAVREPCLVLSRGFQQRLCGWFANRARSTCYGSQSP